MSEMITIKGREVSEDTIALALMQYFTEHPEKYIFQAADVVEKLGANTGKRLIIEIDGKLRAVYVDDGFAISSNNVNGQAGFERCEYRRIGVLSDYIK